MPEDNTNNFEKIWSLLQKEYPNTEPALRFNNPFQLLIATILSAQATDTQVNRVTEHLFKKYPYVNDLAEADIKELEKDIYSTGFYKNKAKNIKKCAQMIKSLFDSKVPDNMNDMLELPGVGRKTANIILSRGFGVYEGIAVDTHVKRLSQRLGLTQNKTPEKIEQDLMKLADKKDWDAFSLTLIHHGRKICHAKNPECENCVVNTLCPSSSV
ncbi:endonuclease III [Methanohalobium sp.]|uniref:endonuclease III n=1 Tax=Methanohalobium sp. TaxID=2837493 RepID=UPI0025F2B7CB|nr:endonuclease III [Methanohalobium sp.]